MLRNDPKGGMRASRRAEKAQDRTVGRSLTEIAQRLPSPNLSRVQRKVLFQAVLMLDELKDQRPSSAIRELCRRCAVAPAIFAAWFDPNSRSYNPEFVDCWSALTDQVKAKLRPLVMQHIAERAATDPASAKIFLQATGDLRPEGVQAAVQIVLQHEVPRPGRDGD